MSDKLSDNALAAIKLVGFDIDGVFTDGRFYLSDDGIESKAFSTQDGYGIRRLLDSGVSVAVISGRKSVAVEKRMQELGVAHVVQGCADKIAAFDRITAGLGISDAECAYVGDDIPDLPLLRKVGISFAVANAVAEVRTHCDYTSNFPGGSGAVREICDMLVLARQRSLS